MDIKRVTVIIVSILSYTFVLSIACYRFGYSNGLRYVEEIVTIPSEPTQVVTEQVSVASPQPSPASAPQSDERYTVKDYAGRIVIMQDGEIVDETNIDVSNLPAEAQERLRKGIEAHGIEELAEIIEAYST